MPIDRSLAEDLAQPLLDLYTGLEQRLTADIARRLRADLGRDDNAERKQAAAGIIRRLTQSILSKLDKDLDGRIAQQLTLAYARGGNNALQELVHLALRPGRAEGMPTAAEAMLRADRFQLGDLQRAARGHHSNVIRTLQAIREAFPGADAIMRLTFALASKLRGTHLPILRWALDAYRQTLAAVALPDVLAGVATRRRASQVAWERLLSQGITGFVDAAGRRWNLASYVEMATRTGVAQAAVEGHLDRLDTAGIGLVIVSNSPMECYRCRPWESKILSKGGRSGARDVQAEHAIEDGRMVTVHIAGTVAEAVAAGLMHPNCTHSLSAYLPGITKLATNTADPEGEKARDRLRALERATRRQKVLAAAALDPTAAKTHQAKVRGLQAQIRDHVAANEHLGLRRKLEREQPDLGNRPTPQRTPATTVPKTPPPPQPDPGDQPVVVREDTRPADGLDDLLDHELRSLATEWDAVPNPGAATRAELLAGLRTVGAVNPAVQQARDAAERAAAEAATPEGRLRQAIASGIGDTTPLTGGAVADVALVTFRDGTRAVRKIARTAFGGHTPGELTDAEELAARVADAIAAPVPALVRTGPTEVYMEYIPDARPAVKVFTKSQVGRRRREAAYSSRGGRAIGLLDQIMANSDRHDGNLLITPDGDMIGIDHGFGWPSGQITTEALRFRPHSLPGPATYYGSTGQWHTTDLTQADIDWVRDQLLSLRPVFATAGRGNYLDYSLARLEQMRPHAQGTVDRLKPGED